MYTNRLIDESSPYLLQHAHNPVDWYPFSTEALQLAKELNKPLLISIGYSSCHWCHVMEQESFENEEIAQFMNEHFVNIKVDREELPDVDHAYMDAIQLIHNSGGWPLNCFALPDGRPFWGGTYFQPQQWLGLLHNVARLYKDNYSDLDKQASEISAGVQLQNHTIQANAEIKSELNFSYLVKTIELRLDKDKGGTKGAPKFPMPSLINFLLEYANQNDDAQALEWVETTLQKMGRGGIFDQLGGGFARYSVDSDWKVPHFEKMLYDNAQLISTYAKAFLLTRNDFYKEIVLHTLEFLQRDLLADEGVYFSALDADSEGKEGLYYTWTKEEFSEVTNPYSELVGEYYGIDAQGLWENNCNILLRTENDSLFAQKQCLSHEELKSLLLYCRKQLLIRRQARLAPSVDNKSLLSWNSLMVIAYTDCYVSFEDKHYLENAISLAGQLLSKMSSTEGLLFRTYKNGHSKINAFLDDYAITAIALLKIYTFSAEEKWLLKCKDIIDYAITNFFDPNTGFFMYSSKSDQKVFSQKVEIYDGVIPSANAVMADVLFQAGKIFNKEDYISISENMLQGMAAQITAHPATYSYWINVALRKSRYKYMIAVIGPDSGELILQLLKHSPNNTIICGSKRESTLGYLQNRAQEGKTMFYVCTDTYCTPPLDSVEAVMEQIRS